MNPALKIAANKGVDMNIILKQAEIMILAVLLILMV